ncbi:MAG: 3-hydroxyacyl-CoA dehydrogenase family protein [Burkholderiales bacterium]
MPLPSQAAAVLGGGTMGADVAAIFLAGGWRVAVVEPNRTRWPALQERIAKACGQLGAAPDPARLGVEAGLSAVPWDGVSLVIECVPESLSLKQSVFAELERLARPETPLASNSSSFPITEIGKGLATGHRMLGLHFFMPAHLVPCVEVVRGEATDPAVCEAVAGTMHDLGKVPVQVRKDIPGFLANRLQHALMREAYALIEQGLASPEDVDNAVRFGFGFRYLAAGPILQKDLSGLDVHAAAATTLYHTLANDQAPPACLRDRVAQGKLGVKTGEGFYQWDAERAASAQARYERALTDALAILQRDRR